MARTSDIDFDKIPSPRPNTSSQKSTRNSLAGPSSASKYLPISQPEPNSGSPDPGDQDNGMDFDDYAPRENRSSSEVSPRRKSFGGIEQEEDNDESGQEEENLQESPSKRDKGKRKAALYEEPDQDDVEDEIAQELENVELDDDPPPPVKKIKTDSKKKKENKRMYYRTF